jgi:hypothetical protein
MLNIMFRAGAVGAVAALRYGSGSTKMMQLLAAPDLQHCMNIVIAKESLKMGTSFKILMSDIGYR